MAGEPSFVEVTVPAEADVLAPDGSEVRLLAACSRGSMAHYTLAPGRCSVAVRHRTVEELWFVTGGEGEMWRRLGDDERVVALHAGVALSLPVGTAFQFRCAPGSGASLTIVGVTMPPWPGDGEAVATDGAWDATAPPGPGLG